MTKPTQWLLDFVEEERLPSTFTALAMDYYIPLAQHIAAWKARQDTPLVIGVNGAQGTGKSTLSKVLSMALTKNHACNTAIISIDDIYHTKATRETLGRTIHPLMATRGVPGTHDTDLGIQLLRDLIAKKEVLIPSFDKACDDMNEYLITTTNGKTAVLLSYNEYRSMKETFYLMRSKANKRRLDEAVEQIETGYYTFLKLA